MLLKIFLSYFITIYISAENTIIDVATPWIIALRIGTPNIAHISVTPNPGRNNIILSLIIGCLSNQSSVFIIIHKCDTYIKIIKKIICLFFLFFSILREPISRIPNPVLVICITNHVLNLLR